MKSFRCCLYVALFVEANSLSEKITEVVLVSLCLCLKHKELYEKVE